MSEQPPKNSIPLSTRIISLIAFAAGGCVFAVTAYKAWGLKAVVLMLLQTLLYVIVAIVLFWGEQAEKRKAAKQAKVEASLRELAALNDVQSVNQLAAACYRGSREARRIAAHGLKNILPRLTEQDTACITLEGMEALIRLLNNPDPALSLVILKALEAVGDWNALPWVERLIVPSEAPGDWLLTDLERVRATAHHCRRVLQVRAEQERLRATLLRPAASPDDPSAMLLRPAGTAPNTPPEQLLRPASPGEG